jgi:uncharacterized protein involved in outer membrane biogenesis
VTEIRVGSIERRSHRRLYWSAAIVLAFVAASMLTLPVTLPGPLRTRLSAALSDRFDSQVTMDALRVSVFPRLRVSGERIELRLYERVGEIRGTKGDLRWSPTRASTARGR